MTLLREVIHESSIVPGHYDDDWPAGGGGSSFTHLVEDADSSTVNLPDWPLLVGPTDYSSAFAQIDAGRVSVNTDALGDVAFLTGLPADANSRLEVHGDGSLHWGDGTAAPDTTTGREGVGTWGMRGTGGEGVQLYSYDGGAGFVIDDTTHNWAFDVSGDNPGLSAYYDGQYRAAFTYDGFIDLPVNGGGVHLKSPDGTQTKTLRLSNAGAVELV